MNQTVTSPYRFGFGYLIWWSVNSGLYDPQMLWQNADACKVPQPVRNALTTTGDKNAWDRATALKERDYRIQTAPGITASYTVRDLDSCNRILVREVLDSANIQLHISQLGVLSFSNSFKFQPDPPFLAFEEEADKVLDRIKLDYFARVGKIDDNKARNAILDWLVSRHRVVVRKAGGIYYIPNSNDDALRGKITEEILSVDAWLKSCELGTLYAVELFDGPTVVREDYTAIAIAELDEQLADVDKKLKAYVASKGMNDGSRMEASRSQVAVMDAILGKIDALNGALGEQIGVAQAKADLIMRRAKAMHDRATVAVRSARAAKG